MFLTPNTGRKERAVLSVPITSTSPEKDSTSALSRKRIKVTPIQESVSV